MNPQSYSMLILCSVKAFHLKFDENATDANVKKWDVHVLTVSSFKTRNRPFQNVLKLCFSVSTTPIHAPGVGCLKLS